MTTTTDANAAGTTAAPNAQHAAQQQPPTTIPLSSEAALFQRRWQQECDTSLLLAADNGKLRRANAALQDTNAELKALADKQREIIDKLEAAMPQQGMPTGEPQQAGEQHGHTS